MKLRKLHIEDYKMFKDFDISFVDDNDEALPIVVLAGVNGSGKTTLLEYIHNREYTNNLEFIKKYQLSSKEEVAKVIYDTIYFPSGIDDIEKVSDEFIKTFYFLLKEKDYRSSEITKHFHEYMKNIFDDLNIGFRYSHLDKDDNLWFSNVDSKEYYYTAKKNKDKNIFTIDELSTGEKTLLSKVLYLYFEGYMDKVILIDEPELSLHPSWQNKVLKIYEKFAKQNNCQIIIATHSPHIIASAKNEYLRILRKNEEGNVEVVSELKAHGRDINSILFDVMGEVAYRPREFDDKIDRLFIEIDNKNLEEAKKQLEALKKSYGEQDSTIMEAQMLIDMFSEE